jgi:hypothetical protein
MQVQGVMEDRMRKKMSMEKQEDEETGGDDVVTIRHMKKKIDGAENSCM